MRALLIATAGVLLFQAEAFAQRPGRLLPRQSVVTNRPLLSENGRHELLLQPDGNLVMYDRPTHRALWSSNTQGNDAAYLTMQPDGNLVIYDRFRRPIWNTGTSQPGSWLAVQDDGNLVIYSRTGPHWSSR